MVHASESNFGSCLDSRPARALLQSFLRDHDAAHNGSIWEDRPQLFSGVVLGEVDDRHGLEAFWLNHDSCVSQATHLEKIAWERYSRTRPKALSFQDGPLTRLLFHEPDIAVTLGLQGHRVDGNLRGLDCAELLEYLVQVFSSDRLIKTCNTEVALKM